MKWKSLLIGLAAVVVVGAAGYGVYMQGMQRGMNMAAGPGSTVTALESRSLDAGPQSVAQGEEATRRHIQAGIKAGESIPRRARRSSTSTIRWSREQVRQAGKSPFMNMMLVPVYAEATATRAR